MLKLFERGLRVRFSSAGGNRILSAFADSGGYKRIGWIGADDHFEGRLLFLDG
jgi:hypothetical protein